MSKSTTKIIVLHESTLESIKRDTFTFLVVVGVIGVGWWLGSAAMEWMGFLMLCLGAFGRAAAPKSRMTPQEAADFIRKEFGVVARDSK